MVDTKDDIVLSIRGMSKSFGRNRVLDHINLDVKRGTVMGLMGENGAGKSTMMKCLFGTYQKDEGRIYLNDKEINFTGPKDALENGIAMVHQELNQCLERNVIDNLFLGRFPTNSLGMVDEGSMKKKASELFRKLGITVNLTQPMRNMSVSQRQMCEIAKAISYNSQVIVLDEPTSSLTVQEVDKLFEMMRMLKEQGIALIYISHKMDEIFQICDEISVLRDGKLVMTKSTQETDMNQLISAMVGRSLESRFPPVDNQPGKTILSVQHLSTKYAPHLQDVTFDVREGEIFGLYGLVGAGRTELLETIFGVRTRAAGRVYFRGKPDELHKSQGGHQSRVRHDHRGTEGQRTVPQVRLDLQHHHRQPEAVQGGTGAVQPQDGEGHQQGDQGHAHQVHGTGRYDLQPVRRQPAEGDLRQMAGAGSPGLHDGRAHPRDRRGRQV